MWGGDALTQHNSSLMICKGRCNRCCQCLVPWTLSSSLSTLAERHLQPGLPLYSTHHSSEAAKKVVVSALYPGPWVLPSVHWLKGTDNQAFPYTALTIVLKLQRNFASAMRRFTLGSFATKFGWFMACYIPTTSQKKEKRKKSSLSVDLVLLVTNWRELAHCHN